MRNISIIHNSVKEGSEMKKIIALVLSLALVLAFAGCSFEFNLDFDVDAKSEGVMTYAEYAAAAVDTEVTVETYVQAKQGWWEKDGVGVASFYTQDENGGYFLYNMPCSKEEYDALTLYSFVNEVERKKQRTAESILAAQDKVAEWAKGCVSA